jgi:hypothetical protein
MINVLSIFWENILKEKKQSGDYNLPLQPKCIWFDFFSIFCFYG